MREVEPPARFRTVRHPPEVLIIRRHGEIGRGGAVDAYRLRACDEVESLDRLRLLDPVDVVGEAAVVGIRERQRSVANRDCQRRPGVVVERGPDVDVDFAGIGVAGWGRARREHRQPPRLAACIVGVPRGVDLIAVIREIEAPPGFHAVRHPPQALVIRSAGDDQCRVRKSEGVPVPGRDVRHAVLVHPRGACAHQSLYRA